MLIKEQMTKLSEVLYFFKCFLKSRLECYMDNFSV